MLFSWSAKPEFRKHALLLVPIYNGVLSVLGLLWFLANTEWCWASVILVLTTYSAETARVCWWRYRYWCESMVAAARFTGVLVRRQPQKSARCALQSNLQYEMIRWDPLRRIPALGRS